jgi:hypothetical protein
MNTSSKPFLVLFGVILALLAGSGAALALAVHHYGTIEVDVHSNGPDGTDVEGLKIPGILAATAVHFIPDSALKSARAEVRAGCRESDCDVDDLGKILKALAESPDCVLVEVISATERVTVAKRNGHIVVDAESVEETVHVKVPLRAARSLLAQLDAG